jgi:hypothetical protein
MAHSAAQLRSTSGGTGAPLRNGSVTVWSDQSVVSLAGPTYDASVPVYACGRYGRYRHSRASAQSHLSNIGTTYDIAQRSPTAYRLVTRTMTVRVAAGAGIQSERVEALGERERPYDLDTGGKLSS